MEQYLNLILKTYELNDLGQQIAIEKKTRVIAESKSVKMSEFYASVNNFSPEIVFVIKGYEYNGEQEVEDEKGKRYKVIRTYRKDFEEMELVCQSLI